MAKITCSSILVVVGSWVPHVSSSNSRLWVSPDAGGESSQSHPKLLFLKLEKRFFKM